MTFEEKVFGRRRFVFERLLRYGFVKTDNGYVCETGFMDGDFSAVISVSDSGEARGKVMDNMNGEEYSQLYNDSFQGAYVNTVRAAYEELLLDIAENCCYRVYFTSEQANRTVAHVFDKYGVLPDFPFPDDDITGVLRHKDTSKWFAIIMPVKMKTVLKNGDETPVDVMNLKAEPDAIPELIKKPGVYPAYHMNHKMWISVTLNDALPDEDVAELLSESYRLTDKKRK